MEIGRHMGSTYVWRVCQQNVPYVTKSNLMLTPGEGSWAPHYYFRKIGIVSSTYIQPSARSLPG
jgi:hypothetical protein